ncbi:MAG: hypothetical protein M0036_13460 [Desulfobacteraceae bacterium]|nr:hypothetical protein [Desulfobacteraceae bacterium]
MKKAITSILMSSLILAMLATAAMADNYVPPFAGQQKNLNSGVDYLSGGVGLNERSQMESMTQPYNLKLIFDVKNGSYLADVGIKIADHHGKVLVDTVSQGPWFYAKLPAGTYKLTGYFDHRSITRTITVGNGMHDLLMTWPTA